MSKTKQHIYDILRGKFLINEDAYKNWKIIIFAAFLALAMIASSHSADNKVLHIAALNKEVKALRSKFVQNRSELMRLKMESEVVKKMKKRGLIPSERPPVRIKYLTKKP